MRRRGADAREGTISIDIVISPWRSRMCVVTLVTHRSETRRGRWSAGEMLWNREEVPGRGVHHRPGTWGRVSRRAARQPHGGAS